MRRTSERLAMRQTGLSLVELMVAMVVGLILLAGVLAIFLASRHSYSTTSAESQIQENGRFALNFLKTDLRMAGNMGCANIATANSILNTGTSPIFDFTKPVYGFEFTGGGGTAPGSSYTLQSNPAPDSNASDWTPALDPTLVGKVMPGSDVIILHGTPSLPITVTQINPNAANFKVATLSGVSTGELGIITDCVKSTIFQIHNTNTPQSLVDHSVGGSVSPGNSQNTFTPTTYQIGAQFLQLQSITYFIGKGADGFSALFRCDLEGTNLTTCTPNEVVPDVASMQVLYGVDTTGAQAPTEYDTAAVVNAGNLWNSVVSVRIALLLRSDLGALPRPATAQTYPLLGTVMTVPQDTRLRRTFTATIGLRSFLP